MRMAWEAMALEMPEVKNHPNRRRFRGVLTVANVPSDRAPSGARGHKVMLTAEATERALPSLLGMAVDYAPELDRHDAQRKVGIITSADLRPIKPTTGFHPSALTTGAPGTPGAHAAAGETHRLNVGGYLFERDFPEVVMEMARRRGQLGMSYEIADVRVVDTEAPVWVATDFKFTGAAVLLREKAAYQGTSMELV